MITNSISRLSLSIFVEVRTISNFSSLVSDIISHNHSLVQVHGVVLLLRHHTPPYVDMAPATASSTVDILTSSNSLPFGPSSIQHAYSLNVIAGNV